MPRPDVSDPATRASLDSFNRDMDRRWRRDTIKKIIERPDAAEIAAEIMKKQKQKL